MRYCRWLGGPGCVRAALKFDFLPAELSVRLRVRDCKF